MYNYIIYLCIFLHLYYWCVRQYNNNNIYLRTDSHVDCVGGCPLQSKMLYIRNIRFFGGKSFINPRRINRRVMVVVWSVFLSVWVCPCVTANLGIYTDRRQMMGTNGISARGMEIIKKRSLKKCVVQKLWRHFATYCDSVNGPIVFTSAIAALYAKEANETLSSTRSRSK